MKPFVRNPYNYDMNAASDETGIDCTKGHDDQDVHGAQQSFKEEVDINTIVKRFNLTGQLPTDLRMPTYADYEEAVDFKTAMDIIANANSTFMQLPAHIRSQFDNDPQAFLEFCSDPDNMDEAAQLGLVNDAYLERKAKAEAGTKADREAFEAFKANRGREPLTPPVDNSTTTTTEPPKAKK